MKTLNFSLMIAVLLLSNFSMPRPCQAAAPSVIVLTAPDVHSAGDIETAVHLATKDGTRPGTVILDGRRGLFSYDKFEGNDYTINIFYSNLTLRGVNGAHIHGDGIFFDDLGSSHILIKDLALTCPSDCIISWGMHRDVTIQNLMLSADGIGIQVAKTDGWTITGNMIQAGWVAVHAIEAAELQVHNNHLGAYIAVMLQRSHGCNVKNNMLHADWQGILVGGNSNYNMVMANSILGIESSGVALEPGVLGNKVHGNKVVCAAGRVCQTVDASETGKKDNKISGNLP